MTVTGGAWVPLHLGSDEDVHALGETAAHVSDIMALDICLLAPNVWHMIVLLEYVSHIPLL